MNRARPASIPCHLEGKAHWANYPLGVAWSLAKAGKPLIGANIYLAGDVPLGAGLSSSAAVEVAVAFALLSESGHAVDRSELAKLCQKAENEFVGARVGIMDQFISCYGRASHALLLDCRTLQHKFVKRILWTAFPEIRALRDVTLSQLEAHRRILPPKVFARCRHVITENERVKSAVEAFHRGDTAALGPLLLESHRSLRAGYAA